MNFKARVFFKYICKIYMISEPGFYNNYYPLYQLSRPTHIILIDQLQPEKSHSLLMLNHCHFTT